MNKYGEYMGLTNDGNSLLNTPVELPSSWKMTCIYRSTRAYSSWFLISVGEDFENNSRYDIGKNTRGSMDIKTPSTTLATLSSSINTGTDYLVTITYKNGEYNLWMDEKHISAIDTTYSPTYFFGLRLSAYSGNGAKIKDIKIVKI